MVGLQLECESIKGVTVVSNLFSFANNFLEDQLQQFLEWILQKHFVWHPPIKIFAGTALWKN